MRMARSCWLMGNTLHVLLVNPRLEYNEFVYFFFLNQILFAFEIKLVWWNLEIWMIITQKQGKDFGKKTSFNKAIS